MQLGVRRKERKILAIPALTPPRPQLPSPPPPARPLPQYLQHPFSTPCPSTHAPPIFLPLHLTFPRSAALPGSWEAPGMGLMAGKGKQGELEPSSSLPAPLLALHLPPLPRQPGLLAPSSHTVSPSCRLTPWVSGWPPPLRLTPDSLGRAGGGGVLLSSSSDARTQAPGSHPLPPAVTEGHEWEKQVREHGTFESTGGTRAGRRSAPCHSSVTV